MKRKFYRCFVLLAVCALTTCMAHAASVTVFAAASLTDALKEIAGDYERRSGDKVVFNFGASSTLARQIMTGAPADIFFSADEAKMDGLQKEGLIVKETRRRLLSNSLVVVVDRIDGVQIRSAQDLATSAIKRLALAEPSTVPAGIYAKEYLQKQNLWAAVENKVVPTENVRAALAAVESGNVEAGIVYKTDAAISKKVKIAWEIPSGEGPSISYPIALVKDAPSLGSAKQLLVELESDRAKAIFKKFGFLVRE